MLNPGQDLLLLVVTTQDILQAALALPEDERLRLLEELDASIEVSVGDAFLTELKKRQEDFHRGVPGVPAKEVFARLRNR